MKSNKNKMENKLAKINQADMIRMFIIASEVNSIITVSNISNLN